MPELAIREIIADPAIQIRSSNHEQTIHRYADSFDKLPPIDVFETPDGKYVADGFQRLAAAQRIGRTMIAATVHKGSYDDAIEFAAVANTRSGDPLTIEERNDGIRRLKQLHPDWTQSRIADAMSVGTETVRTVFRVDEVRRKNPAARNLSVSHLAEVASADPAEQDSLIEAVGERGWSRDVTRLAVQNLKDDRIPDQQKQELLSGKIDPVVITPDGEMAVPATVIGKRIRDIQKNDALLQLEKSLEQLAKLRMFDVNAIVSTAGQPRVQRLVEELPGYIDFLGRVLREARSEGRKLKVV